ncbi:e3 ubiquitin-protein ligase [Anaeramoeba flamelloides]|uniref:E3 ubiquitin-protein ligase n=1 Tax=Anaeramoeba flamelloides TaxID=1746091 RepID=A0AAV7YWC4_9EUKA|nr:e3 ubiquitin-protein ligase [Anaeramoeba flamelloides]
MDDADYLDCSICLNNTRHCVATNCGHSFCAKCILDSLDEVNPNCPNCRSVIYNIYPNYLVRRLVEIQNQKNDLEEVSQSTDYNPDEKQELDQRIKSFNDLHHAPEKIQEIVRYDAGILRNLMTSCNNRYSLIGWIIIFLVLCYIFWTDDLIPLESGLVGILDDVFFIVVGVVILHFIVKYFEKRTRERNTQR